MLVRRVVTGTFTVFVALGGVMLTSNPALANAGTDLELIIGPAGRTLAVGASLTQGVANGNGTRQVAFACTAVATGDVASTALNTCTLVVNGTRTLNQPLAAPGAAIASGGFSLQVPSGAGVSVCAAGSATFLDASRLVAGKCTPVIRIAALDDAGL